VDLGLRKHHPRSCRFPNFFQQVGVAIKQMEQVEYRCHRLGLTGLVSRKGIGTAAGDGCRLMLAQAKFSPHAAQFRASLPADLVNQRICGSHITCLAGVIQKRFSALLATLAGEVGDLDRPMSTGKRQTAGEGNQRIQSAA